MKKNLCNASMVLMALLIVLPLLAAKKQPDRNKFWSELVSYFSDWKLDQVDGVSGLLQTQWTIISEFDEEVTPTQKLKNLLQTQISLVLSPEASLKKTFNYRMCMVGGSNPPKCFPVTLDLMRDGAKKEGPMKAIYIQFAEAVAKVEADIAAIEAKYKP